MLRKIDIKDLESIAQWFKNIHFLELYDYVPPVPKSFEEVEKTIKDYEDDKDSIVFGILNENDNRLIGITGFYDILWDNGVATLFIGIGDEKDRGLGYGKKSLVELINYGFRELKLHRIQLNVISYNSNAKYLYESLGFVKEGTYREFLCRQGKRLDMYLYSILESEWSASDRYGKL